MRIQNITDFTLFNQLLCMTNTAEKVHNMTCHENYTSLFTGSNHLIAISITQSDGFSQNTFLPEQYVWKKQDGIAFRLCRLSYT